MVTRKNCWEIKQCGREQGGANAEMLGVCPATRESRLNEIHGGLNAGRACWVVTGTLCEGEVQGSFAKKYSSCKECDFYKTVQNQEYPNFKLSAQLLSILR